MFDRVPHGLGASLAPRHVPQRRTRPAPPVSCHRVTDLTTFPPLLLPTPRSLERLPGARTPTDAPTRLDADRSLPPEGYRLHIDTSRGVVVNSATPAGCAHAQRTLAQLRTQYPDTLPPLRIEDAPALTTRGVMLDISRSRVPTMDSLLSQTDLFASLKLNHLQLYVEHAFAYHGHEQVWQGADPITPDELTRLDAHAASLGVDLAANQNCFGHMARWLNLPRYAPLAETHDGFDFYGIPRRGPFSLCPTDPASLELTRDLLSQQIPCVSSGLVNIGCDETADLGAGRSRDAIAQHGRTRVYMDYVASVCEIARSLGARPMLWGDIALSEPDAVGELPQDAIALAWGYEPDSPFDDWGRTLAASGRDWLACPGTSSWRSFTGRTTQRRQNLDQAVHAAIEHAAQGMLMTDWGDLGHRQQSPIALLAIAEGAQATWNPGAPVDPRAVSLHVFSDPSLRVADWIAQLGDADNNLRDRSGVRVAGGHVLPLRNASALFEHLHPSGARTHLPIHAEPWRDVLDRIEALSRSRPSGLTAPLADRLGHTLNIARFSALLAIGERESGAITTRDLEPALEAIIREHQRLWLTDSRPGGLTESVEFFESLRPRTRSTAPAR